MPAPGQLVVQPWEHDALRHYEAGETMPQIADELGVKASTLGSCFARWKRLGALSGSRRERGGVQVNWERVHELTPPRCLPHVVAGADQDGGFNPAPGAFTSAEVAALRSLASRELAAAAAPDGSALDGAAQMFSVRLPPALLAAVRAKATQVGYTPTQVVRELLTRWVAGQV